jgi:histidinol dehydrogenase
MIIYVKNIKDAIKIANYKAPEHLLIIARETNKILTNIKNAPAIFIGNDTPVAFGDYIAGANHILPTNGTSRFFSALSVLDFLKHTHIIRCSRKALKRFGPSAELMAGTEQLFNHCKSLEIRRK